MLLLVIAGSSSSMQRLSLIVIKTWQGMHIQIIAAQCSRQHLSILSQVLFVAAHRGRLQRMVLDRWMLPFMVLFALFLCSSMAEIFVL
jgi:hypothetical protein